MTTTNCFVHVLDQLLIKKKFKIRRYVKDMDQERQRLLMDSAQTSVLCSHMEAYVNRKEDKYMTSLLQSLTLIFQVFSMTNTQTQTLTFSFFHSKTIRLFVYVPLFCLSGAVYHLSVTKTDN